MSSIPTRSTEQIHQQYIVRSLMIIGVMIVMEFFGFLHGLRSIEEKMLLPSMRLGNECVHVVEIPYFALSKQILGYQHVQDLELRYAEAVAQLAEIDRLRAENQALRDLLHDTDRTLAKEVIAPIIGYGKPFIAAGSEKGVGEGNMVLLQNVLIVRIGQVSTNQAEVIVLGHPNSIPVLAKTEHGVTGTIIGDGRRIWLTELPVDADVQIGERVVTVGQSGIAPGIALGKISTIEKKDGAPTQRATIDQLVSFYESQMVEVRPE